MVEDDDQGVGVVKLNWKGVSLWDRLDRVSIACSRATI